MYPHCRVLAYLIGTCGSDGTVEVEVSVSSVVEQGHHVKSTLYFLGW